MRILYIIISMFLFSAVGNAQSNQVKTIILGSQKKGRMFEGIGALSAGASTRLLMDYPKEQQDAILDLLFKPKYGASLHHLKVEIGADVNSTSGTEPSHARNRGELEKPLPSYYNRGYEWWLMKEAKKRNESIYLDCLQWGSPGWLGDGAFYSTDNIHYMIAFLTGAKKYQNLNIDYIGIWNERLHDIEFVKNLKKELIRSNLSNVKIIASDLCSGNQWKVADDLVIDPELMEAVDVIGDHYIEKEFRYHATDNAMKTNKPLWNSEGGPWKGNWDGFKELAKLYNRDYIIGKITKTITWSLITSYYENLALPNSGLMKADSPWSGYFEIEPALWAAAHTTQFTEPGWYYLDEGCGFAADSTVSYVTMVSPNEKDITIIVESMESENPVSISFDFSKKFNVKKLSQWVSVLNQESFINKKDVLVKDGVLTLNIQPKSLYTFSSTRGQQKGSAVIPVKTPFPFPYKEDFNSGAIGTTPKYISDQGGAFEITNFEGTNNKVLKQVITRPAIEWEGAVINQTVVGNTEWQDYTIAANVFFMQPYSYGCISGRLTETHRSHKEAEAYTLRLFSSGKWELKTATKILESGYNKIDNTKWHSLKLIMKGDQIQAYIDQKCVASVRDNTYTKGMIGLGSSFHETCFDNLVVE